VGECNGEMNEQEVHFLECHAPFDIQRLALPHQPLLSQREIMHFSDTL